MIFGLVGALEGLGQEFAFINFCDEISQVFLGFSDKFVAVKTFNRKKFNFFGTINDILGNAADLLLQFVFLLTGDAVESIKIDPVNEVLDATLEITRRLIHKIS